MLSLIAEHVSSNIRELEGSLTRLVAYASLVNEPTTMELAQTVLKDTLQGDTHKALTAGLIMQTVGEYYQVSVEDIMSSSRRREFTTPRQVAMYLTREMTDMSLPQIGTAFGNRDHTTVLHGWNVVDKALKESPQMEQEILELKQKLQG